MRSRRALLRAWWWLALTVCGCDFLYPEPASGPLNNEKISSTYSEIAETIFTPKCALAGCHSNPLVAPMSLAAEHAYANLVETPSFEVPSLHRIEPFAPERSYLWYKVLGRASEVQGRATRMPLNRTPLTPSEIALIEAWIADGAPDN